MLLKLMMTFSLFLRLLSKTLINIYGIKNCDSVKKAIKFFKNNSLEFTFIDFNDNAPDLKKIESWLQKTSIDNLFNARSTTYRNLKLKDQNLTNDEKATWLTKENRLIKRPVIEYDNQLIIGYNEKVYIENFL